MKKNSILAVALSALLLFSGCATTDSGSGRQLVAKLAVTYATMKVIERNPGHAQRIIEISQTVKEAAGGGKAATVKLLVELIKAEIRWNTLSAADAMIVNLLVDEIGAQLTARIGDGQLDSVNLLVVAEVASWIEQAAKASAPR